MSLATSQILKYLDITKKYKNSRFFENEPLIFLQIKRLIHYPSRANNSFVAEVTVTAKQELLSIVLVAESYLYFQEMHNKNKLF